MNALRLFGMGERLLAWEAVPENSKCEDGGLLGRGTQLS